MGRHKHYVMTPNKSNGDFDNRKYKRLNFECNVFLIRREEGKEIVFIYIHTYKKIYKTALYRECKQ